MGVCLVSGLRPAPAVKGRTACLFCRACVRSSSLTPSPNNMACAFVSVIRCCSGALPSVLTDLCLSAALSSPELASFQLWSSDLQT